MAVCALCRVLLCLIRFISGARRRRGWRNGVGGRVGCRQHRRLYVIPVGRYLHRRDWCWGRDRPVPRISWCGGTPLSKSSNPVPIEFATFCGANVVRRGATHGEATTWNRNATFLLEPSNLVTEAAARRSDGRVPRGGCWR